MINPSATPFRFFLLGATGRAGLPFLAQALARGHVVTIFVRDVSKFPVALASHPRLRTFTGELHEADKMARAMGEANPDVVFVMLASETPPYTAASTGTHSALKAIAAVKPNSMPFISIAAWGLGPTGDYITGFFTRTLVGIAKTLFWSKPSGDSNKRSVLSINFVDAAGLRPQDGALVGLSNFPSFDRNHADEELDKLRFGFF